KISLCQWYKTLRTESRHFLLQHGGLLKIQTPNLGIGIGMPRTLIVQIFTQNVQIAMKSNFSLYTRPPCLSNMGARRRGGGPPLDGSIKSSLRSLLHPSFTVNG